MKDGRISLRCLKCRLFFHLQDEGMSDSSGETLEKALGLRLICTGGLTSIWHNDRHAEFNASKGDDAWLFLKIDRNPNITVPNRMWPSVSCLTSRNICIVLPSLVSPPEVSVFTRQEYWLTDQSRVLNHHPGHNSRIYPRFLLQLEKNHETSPSPRDEDRFPCNACRAIPCSQWLDFL